MSCIVLNNFIATIVRVTEFEDYHEALFSLPSALLLKVECDKTSRQYEEGERNRHLLSFGLMSKVFTVTFAFAQDVLIQCINIRQVKSLPLLRRYYTCNCAKILGP